MAESPGAVFAGQYQSPFMAIPPELRNRIYQMAFADLKLCVCLPGKEYCITSTLELHRVCYGENFSPGVLMACHQTYSEAVGLFFSNANFYTKYIAHLADMLERLPAKYSKLVQNVTIGSSDVSSFPESLARLPLKYIKLLTDVQIDRLHVNSGMYAAVNAKLMVTMHAASMRIGIANRMRMSGARSGDRNWLQPGVVKAKIVLFTGEVVTSSTPLATYLASLPKGVNGDGEPIYLFCGEWYDENGDRSSRAKLPCQCDDSKGHNSCCLELVAS